MKLSLGLILTLVGGAVVLVGMYMALAPVIHMYQANLENAMGQPDGAEQQVGKDMWKGVIVGAVGIVPFLIGTVLLKAALFRKIRNKFAS